MKMEKCVLLCLMCTTFLGFSQCLPIFLRGRPRGGMVGTPAVPHKLQVSELPPEEWLVQRLDHFNDADTRTWKQRYFVNKQYYKLGGPVFLMIGGEGTANPIWMVAGHWITLAKKHGALCLMLEHRFYGKSHPTEDLKVENLRYLNSEQALADLAYFSQSMKMKMKLDKNKWIAFGGSYPGSLAAWYRLKFPHLVDGSVASSAPIFAELDFKEYLGVVRDALATTGPQCNVAVKIATKMIQNMIEQAAGRDKLKTMFRLCEDIDIKDRNDVANLFSTLAGNFEGVVQYNKDNRAFEGAVGTNVTINTLCDIMTDKSLGDELNRYSHVNQLIMKIYKQKCVDFKYNTMIKELQQTDWTSSASEGGRQWMYQTCTEFGFFQSSSLQNQPFGHSFPASFSVQQCMDIYGAKFNSDLIGRGINRTNTNYGGFGLKVTKIVFPNGSIDPWHALGITKDLSPDAQAVFINGTAHCANMYPESPNDPPQLVKARTQIDQMVAAWISH